MSNKKYTFKPHTDLNEANEELKAAIEHIGECHREIDELKGKTPDRFDEMKKLLADAEKKLEDSGKKDKEAEKKAAESDKKLADAEKKVKDLEAELEKSKKECEELKAKPVPAVDTDNFEEIEDITLSGLLSDSEIQELVTQTAAADEALECAKTIAQKRRRRAELLKFRMK